MRFYARESSFPDTGTLPIIWQPANELAPAGTPKPTSMGPVNALNQNWIE
jgi:hypothetical protein